MWSNLTWRNLTLALVAAIVLGVVAGTLLNGSSTPQTVPLISESFRLVPTATVAPDVLAASVRSGEISALVLIQGLKERRLVVWPLDSTDPPYEIERQVSAWPLLPDPTGTRVLYSTERTVMVLDVAARRSAIIGTLPPGGKVLLAQWSPDGQSLAFVVEADEQRISYVTLADGSLMAREMQRAPRGLPMDVGWLADGRPVSITLGVGPVGGLVGQVRLFDPSTGDTVLLPQDVPVIQPWAPWKSPDGSRQVYATTTWEEARYKGSCQAGPLAITGSDWLYAAVQGVGGPPRIIYELDGMYLDRPMWLPDDRIIFRAVADDICTPQPSGLYIGRVGLAPVKLVEAEPGYVSDESDKLLWSTSFALNPTYTRIAWSENDLTAQRSTVYVMPVTGGDPEMLVETTPPSSDVAFEYRDSETILYFIWLP